MTTEEQTTAGLAAIGNILAVDDEESIRSMLFDLLTDLGHQVTVAVDGQDALDTLKEQQFDLIISDMLMPRLNGIELLQASLRMYPQCPVVMITGAPSVDTVVKLIKLGATDYLIKPFSLEMMAATITKALLMKRLRGDTPQQAPTGSDSSIDGASKAWDYDQFHRLLEGEIGRSELRDHSFSLLVIEIEELERRAGEGGERSGGELGEKFTEILTEQSRPGDIIGRLREHEWGMILPETNRGDSEKLGQVIKEESEWYFSLSGGISCYPWDGSDADSLLVAARSSLEVARARGGSVIISSAR